MTRAISQYPRLDGGVTQAPLRMQSMRQLLAMDNMVFDPNIGLGRRPGAELLDSYVASLAGITGARTRTHTIETDTTRYSVVYPAAANGIFALVNNTDESLGTVAGSGTLYGQALSSGVEAITNVGDLIVMAVSGTAPSAATTRPWANQANQKHHLVWVRGGAYSRTFTVKLLRGNKRCVVQYTTLEAAYPGVLDTSDILPTDPDYSKKVNDRTNVYNSYVNAWTADALADIAPENIAAKLADGIRRSGFLASGETVTAEGAYVIIVSEEIEELEADDGGDGNLMRAVGNTVGAPELLSVNALPGKIVKVRPGESERSEVFYLEAVAKDGSTGANTPVTWEECAGEVTSITSNFLYGCVSGDTLYLGSLAYVNSSTGRDFADWTPNIAGDTTSNPAPDFIGKQITAMAVFQDRLLLTVEGGYVAASQPGNYFAFFLDSAITVLATDPVTFFIVGGEGDTVHRTLTYDRNLLLVGKRQYLINGRVAMQAGSASATVFSNVPGMDTEQPAVVDTDLFYVRYTNGHGSVHTMRPGRVDESPYVTEATASVNTYMDRPHEIAVMTTPSMAFIRSEDDTIFVVDYEHGEGQQRYAIHRWTLGYADARILAIMEHDSALQIVIYDEALGAVRLLAIRLQRADGVSVAAVRHFDEIVGGAGIGQFSSKVTLVPVRLSPEAGNVTGTGFGDDGASRQQITLTHLAVYVSNTASIQATVAGTRRDPVIHNYEAQ